MPPKAYGAKTLKEMCAETISNPTGHITPGTPLWKRWFARDQEHCVKTIDHTNDSVPSVRKSESPQKKKKSPHEERCPEKQATGQKQRVWAPPFQTQDSSVERDYEIPQKQKRPLFFQEERIL
jgi:hypothetical protein